jgi:hypothetical protein
VYKVAGLTSTVAVRVVIMGKCTPILRIALEKKNKMPNWTVENLSIVERSLLLGVLKRAMLRIVRVVSSWSKRSRSNS